MTLTLGFSPCPNDTFIFDAMVNGKIDTGDLSFDVVMEDVETLNRSALEGRLDITKLSFPAFFRSLENYILLNAGSALGKGVGPLLITRSEKEVSAADVINATIVLPGENTTANLLFSHAYPEAGKKQFMRFDKIEDFVLESSKDILGVIIHENRFTYQQKGLHKVADLGEVWEQKMKLPIPLGGIAIKRILERETALKVDMLIRKSLDYAFSNYPFITDYVKDHAREMDEQVMRQHIDLYVNNYSLGLGVEGQQAIEAMHTVYHQLVKTEKTKTELFL
ncbi:MAG: 1,4-dihydroxy-6-naphthoate synthase [Chitinophagaceae bacterium]|nr:1,4-dihydroxy-6-naphthoate synthase [Chitinophagaceae bacterium]